MLWNGEKKGIVGICGVREIGVFALIFTPKNHRLLILPGSSMTTPGCANWPQNRNAPSPGRSTVTENRYRTTKAY